MVKKCSILTYRCNEEYNDGEEPVSYDGVFLLPLFPSLVGWTCHPWKDVKVQLTCECTSLLRSFFSDAKFVVFELQVGQLGWCKCEAPGLRFQGKSRVPLSPLPLALLPAAAFGTEAALVLTAMPWTDLSWKLAKVVDFLEGSSVQEWEPRWVERAIEKPCLWFYAEFVGLAGGGRQGVSSLFRMITHVKHQRATSFSFTWIFQRRCVSDCISAHYPLHH